MGSPNRFANLSPGAHALELFDENFDYIDGLESELGSLKGEMLSTVNPIRYGAVDDGATNCISAIVSCAALNAPVTFTGKSYVATVTNQVEADAFFGMLKWLNLLCDKLTVTFAAGVFSFSSRIEINVTNGSRLLVNAAAPLSLTLSSLGTVSSVGAGDHSVTWNVTSAAGVSIGDFLMIDNLVGTDFKHLEGCWKVTNVVGNAITVENSCRQATMGSPVVSAARLRRASTILQFTNSMGFYVMTPATANSGETCGFKDFLFSGVGAGNYDAVFVEYGASISIQDCGINRFGRHGVYAIVGGIVYGLDLFISACGSHGIYMLSNSYFQGVNSISNGNGSYGVVASVDSLLTISGSNCSGNVANYFASMGGFIVAENSFAHRATNYGVEARGSSTVDFQGSVASDNGLYDLHEEDEGSRIIGGTGTNNHISTLIKRRLTFSVVHSFGTISGDSESTLVVSAPGVTSAFCVVSCSCNGAVVAGFIPIGVPGTDQITLVGKNTLPTNISVGSRTYSFVAEILA